MQLLSLLMTLIKVRTDYESLAAEVRAAAQALDNKGGQLLNKKQKDKILSYLLK
jgi:hypothetical protein